MSVDQSRELRLGVADHLAWCRARELSESTIRQRRAVLGRFAGELGLADATAATREQVESW